MEGILYFTLTCVSSLLYTCYNQIKHEDKAHNNNTTNNNNKPHNNNTKEVSHYIFTHIKETITNISTIIVSSFYTSNNTDNTNTKKPFPPTTSTTAIVNNAPVTNEYRTKFDIVYIENIINNLQVHIQNDEGNRGIIKCAQNSHINQYKELFLATSNLLSSPDLKRVIILTGFPCNMEYDPPMETDGILGALAVAR